jgi:hypothetical protein
MAVPFIIRPRLLLVANDLPLLYSREMVLGTRFAVHISARTSEALYFLRDSRFDLVVILQPNETWRRFAGFVAHQIPSPKLLVVTGDADEFLEWPGALLTDSPGLYELLKACMEIFGMVSRTKSQGYLNRSFERVRS